MAQRIMQYQSAMQLAQSAPQMYNMKELHREMVMVLGIPDVDSIVPDDSDVPAVDPVTAVQNLINNVPVKAYEYQDHDAHIQTVAAAQDNPEIRGLLENAPTAPAIFAAASAYINDHLTMKFRDQVEKEMGIELPPIGEPIPADIEKRISELVAEAASRVTEIARIEAQQKQQLEQQRDPLVVLKEREVGVKEAEVQRKALGDQARFAIAKEKLDADTQHKGAELGVQIAGDLLAEEKANKKQALEEYKLGLDLGKNIVEDSNKNE